MPTSLVVKAKINSAMKAGQGQLSKGSSRIPRCAEVQRKLFQRILEGDYRAGDKLLTDREVMQRFSVGRMTARAAINSLVEQNVVTRKPGCGTFLADLDEWAQEGQTQVTKYTALLAYQDMSKSHAGSDDNHLLATIHEALRRDGVEANLLALPLNGERAYHMLDSYLKSNKPDGVIMHAIADERLYELVEHLPAVAGNLVLFSHVVEVCPDFRDVVDMALEHLVRLGHKEIGLLTETRHSVQVATSWSFAFERKLQESQREVRRELIRIPRTAADLESAVKRMLKADDRPTAVLAIGPDAVELIYRFAGRYGLKIPSDLSVFGYGQACEYVPFEPPLTYMTYRLEDFGTCHAVALRQQWAGKIPDRGVRQVPVHLVAGESTGAPGRT